MKKIGKYPADAEIFIDFVKKKVSVKYPFKIGKFKSVFSMSMSIWICFLGYIYVYLLLFFIPFLIGFAISFLAYLKIYRPQYFSHFFNIFFGRIGYEYKFSKVMVSGLGYTLLKACVIILLILFLPPLILTAVYYMFPKKMSYYLPYLNSFLARRISRINKIRFSRIKRKEVVIPYFMNNMVKYKATEDYSKYMKSIHIKPFKVKRRNEIKILTWQLYFNFKRVPKKGYLDVEFV